MRERIGVVGAGLMGHGIAQVFAAAGHDVAITDPMEGARAGVIDKIRANLADLGQNPEIAERVSVRPDLASTVRNADLIIEAAPETLALKQDLFQEIEGAAKATALFASNTSVIPITAIMEKVRDKTRALGTHWWNPPFLVPLVEVVRTAQTSDAAMARTIEILTKAGKTAVEVKKDVAGFVGNRLQHALWREAIALVEEGICDAETVDAVVKASFGRRLAVLGPLENADLVGTDLTLAIHEVVLPHIDSRPGPSPFLRRLVAEGRLGFKSGEGFRRWSEADQKALRQRVFDYLKNFDERRV